MNAPAAPIMRPFTTRSSPRLGSAGSAMFVPVAVMLIPPLPAVKPAASAPVPLFWITRKSSAARSMRFAWSDPSGFTIRDGVLIAFSTCSGLTASKSVAPDNASNAASATLMSVALIESTPPSAVADPNTPTEPASETRSKLSTA